MNKVVNNQLHYDHVTDAWTLILGDNLHYGFFETAEDSLDEATDALIDEMAGLAPINRDTHVLDVGCGIGNPAFHISSRTGCRISGISISARGIEIAQDKSRRNGLSGRVTFYQRDALNNGFPDGSFDVAWVMESSHLMRDKKQLIAENFRVLRPGGAMLLCDLILKQEFSVMDIYRYRDQLNVLERCFGKAKMETLDFYEGTIRAQGFECIEIRDISNEAFPTLDKWRQNLERNQRELAGRFSAEEIDLFARACDILTELFTAELLGYGMLKAVKPA